MAQILRLKEDKIEGIQVYMSLDSRNSRDSVKQNSFHVAVMVSYNRRTYYYRTGYKCTLEEYERLCKSDGRGANSKTSIWVHKQNLLKTYKKVLDTVEHLSSQGLFTFENLKTNLTGRSKESFMDVWYDIIKKTKKLGTKESYLNAYNAFIRYAGPNITFDRIGPKFIQGWLNYMEKQGLSRSSHSIYLCSIRVAINKCIRLGKIKRSQYPFGKDDDKVKIPKAAKRTECFIDIATIRKIMDFQAPDKWSSKYADDVYQSIGFWLFSYLAGGMNVADMATITWNEYYFGKGKESDLSFVRQKVEDSNDGEKIYIAISQDMRKILDKYGSTPELGKRIFPQILGYENPTPEQIDRRVHQVNANIRKHLNRVCKELELMVNVSSTWARHSFKSNAVHIGLPHDYVEFSMGHSAPGVEGNYLGAFPLEQRIRYAERLLQPQQTDPLADLSPKEREAVMDFIAKMRG